MTKRATMDLNYTAEDKAFRAVMRQWFAENLSKESLTTLEQRFDWKVL